MREAFYGRSMTFEPVETPPKPARCSYEAFVIYTFLSLCLEFVGGPGEVEVKMNGFVLHPSFLHCTCCFPPQRVDGLFVRRCKQGALQFVLLMPILGILSVVLYATGNYSPGYWGPSNGCAYCASACSSGTVRQWCCTAAAGVKPVRGIARCTIWHVWFGSDALPTSHHRWFPTLQVPVHHDRVQRDVQRGAAGAVHVLHGRPRPAGALQPAAEVCAGQVRRLLHLLAGAGSSDQGS
jgi:Organic solute transporter Ostalpha